MDMVNFTRSMEQCIKDNGKMTKKVERERRLTWMEATVEILSKIRNKARDY